MPHLLPTTYYLLSDSHSDVVVWDDALRVAHVLMSVRCFPKVEGYLLA